MYTINRTRVTCDSVHNTAVQYVSWKAVRVYYKTFLLKIRAKHEEDETITNQALKHLILYNSTTTDTTQEDLYYKKKLNNTVDYVIM